MNFRKTIARLFKSQAEDAAAQRRAETLARLSSWLDQTALSMERELSQAVIKEGGPYHSFAYSTQADASDLTKDDLETLRPCIERLHDLCKAKDVSLEIAGFDLLPRNGTATSHSWARVPAILIVADTGRTYNDYAHPGYDPDSHEGPPRISFERPRACSIG